MGKERVMPESEQNKQNEFVIERMKERPVNKKKLLRRTIITATMAAVFGLIACTTFLILEPLISNWINPEEEPEVVVFPEDSEEMSPEEMLMDNMMTESQNNQQAETPDTYTLDRNQVKEILDSVTVDKDNYRQIYYSMEMFADQCNRSMVAVTGISSNVDWLNNVEESKNKSYGVIIANNGKELLILTDFGPLEKAESMTLTFDNQIEAPAHLKEVDYNTNLAIVAVNLEDFSPVMLEKDVQIASLGTSNVNNIVGTPVIALGSPMGIGGSMDYGMVTAVSSQISKVDTSYHILQTNIAGSQNAGGVLFNLNGQVVGIITNNQSTSDMKNVIIAYGISELKKCIEKMSNGKKMAYLGICGVDVTKEANEEMGVPYGAYITEVAMDSPAMMAGIKQGDVLVNISGRDIQSFGEYATELLQMDVGETVQVTVMRQAQDEYKEMKFDIVLQEANRK